MSKNKNKANVNRRFRKVEINHQNEKKRARKEYTKIILLAVFLLAIICGTSYAFLSDAFWSTKKVEVTAGTFDIEFQEGNNINLNNAVPMNDQEGMTTESYQFSIHNSGTLDAKYDISLEEDPSNTLDRNYVKYSIKEGDGEWSTPALLSSGLSLKTGRTLASEQSISYELKLWLDESATNDVQGQSYGAKIVVNAIQTNATITDFTTPILLLNGASTVHVNQGEKFTDLGVSSVKDDKDELNIADVTTTYEYYNGIDTVSVSSIDTTQIGIYYIYYKISDSQGNVGITVRTVIVSKKDNNLPTISLIGDEVVMLQEGDNYQETGAIANDAEDGDLTKKIVTVGQVNTKLSGTYIVKYLIEDSDGNVSSVVRTVIVQPVEKELEINVVYGEEDISQAIIEVTATTSATDVTYALTNQNQKPGDSAYQPFDESDNGVFTQQIVITRNGTYYLWIKDSNGNIKNKSITITHLDKTKPICEFKTNGYLGIGIDSTVDLICTDIVGIEKRYLVDSNFIISNLDVVDLLEVSAPVKVENGYQWTLILKPKTLGEFTLTLPKDTVSDKVGNQNNEVISSEIKVTELEVDNTDILLDVNGSDTHTIEATGTNIGSLSYESSDDSVATVSSEGVITAVAPGDATVTVSEGNGNAKREIKVTVQKTLTAIFTINGRGISSISSTQESCKLTKDNLDSCEITSIPEIIVKNGYQAIGWNTDQSSHDGLEKIVLTDNSTFYTISKKLDDVYTAIFDSNQDSAILSVEGAVSCSIPGAYNNEEQVTSCDIDVPTITGKDPTPVVLGFATTSSSKTGELEGGGVLTLTSENTLTTWYAITTNLEKTYTATFLRNAGNGVSLQTWEEKTCSIESTYNGIEQATSCTINDFPSILVEDGYTAIGWNTDQNSHQGLEQLTLSSNTNFYTIVKKNSVTYTATLHKNGTGVTSIGSSYISCDTSETFNGEEESTSCVPIQKLPSITVQNGYTALGWSQNLNATEKALDTDLSAMNGYLLSGSSIVLDSNIDLYSISKKDDITYSVFFDGNGATLSDEGEISCFVQGAFNNDSQSQTCTIEVPMITRDGFDIIGFSTDQNNESTDVSTHLQEGTILDLTAENTGTTYYAITKKDVTIHWNPNGATLNTLLSSRTIWNQNVSATIEAPSIIRDGYEIIGWSMDSDATENSSIVGVGDVITFDDDLDYYAITKRTYDAIFYYYNGTKQATDSTSCNIYNTVTTCDFTIPDSVENSIGPHETKYKGLSNTASNPNIVTSYHNSTLTYYAVYDTLVDVSFYYYDGSSQTKEIVSSFRTATTDGTSYTIKEADLEVPDVVKGSSGIGLTSYQGVASNINSTVGVSSITTANLNYYAYYQGVWTISFGRDESTTSSISATSASCNNYATSNGSSYSISGASSCSNITLPTITAKTGYTVDGWYDDNTKIGTSGDQYTITETKSLIAKANINSYTVTYDYATNGGTSASVTSQKVNYGNLANLTPTAEKDGYDFLGWNTDENATSGLTTAPTVTGNLTLYAIFRKSTSISLDAKTATYTGSAISANAAVVSDGPENPSISYTYYTDSSCSTKTTTSTGASSSGKAPVDVGNYYVTATVAAASNFKSATTACVAHTITVKEVTVNWGSTVTFNYNGFAQAPTAIADSGISRETLNITRTTATNAGNHTSTASIDSVSGGRAKTTNYKLIGNSQSFVINKIDPTLELSATSGSVNKNSTTTFTEKANVAGSFANVSGTTTVATVSPGSYSSIAANTEKTVTITGVSNGTSIIAVTFMPTDTTNYNTKTATYTVTGYLVATTGSCASLTYNGSSQILASGGTGVSYSNNSGTNATSYTVGVSANSGYRFSDGTTSKTLSCSIAKKAVTVTASSSSKTYDGAVLSNTNGCSVTSGSVVSGDTLTCTNTGSITNKGSATNTLSTVTIKSGTTDVTSNYSVTKKNGTLTINARETTCTSGSVSKAYDGTALTNNTVNCTNLVNGHTSVVGSTANSGTITNVGSTTNTLNSVVIKNGQTDVSSNYTITKANGTLTVTRATTATTGSCASLTYNGSNQTLASGATNANYSDNTGTAAGSYTVTVTSGSNYAFSDGTTSKTLSCSIAKKVVTVTASSSSKTYDGEALSNTDGCSVTSGSVVSGHTLTCKNTGNITNKGSVVNTLSTVTIKSGTTDVSSNYTITKANGTLTVNARATTCTSGSASKTYDGTALTSTTTGSCTNLVSGHTATFSGHTGSITNAGNITNTFGSVVIKSGTTNVSSNYAITKANGTLTINTVSVAMKFSPNNAILTSSTQTAVTSGVAASCSTANGIVTCTCSIGNSYGCGVTSPAITTAPTNTPTTVGFHTSSSACTSSWDVSTRKTVYYNTTGTTYYAQTKKEAVTLKSTFTGTDEPGISSISSTDASCTLAQVCNGTAQATSCSITAPTITATTGNTALGWYNSSGTKVASSGGKFSISSSLTYTAKASITAAGVTYSDTYSMGCTTVQCAIDKISGMLK